MKTYPPLSNAKLPSAPQEECSSRSEDLCGRSSIATAHWSVPTWNTSTRPAGSTLKEASSNWNVSRDWPRTRCLGLKDLRPSSSVGVVRRRRRTIAIYQPKGSLSLISTHSDWTFRVVPSSNDPQDPDNANILLNWLRRFRYQRRLQSSINFPKAEVLLHEYLFKCSHRIKPSLQRAE